MSEQPPPLRECVELPGRGTLELRTDERRVVFLPRRGSARRFDAHPIFEEPGRLARVARSDGRSALIARDASDRLYVFDAERQALRPVPGFTRLPRAEVLRLHAVSGGFLVVTENGIAALDETGNERWRIDDVTFGWRLLVDAGEVLWLCDGSGNVLGLDAVTGREAAR